MSEKRGVRFNKYQQAQRRAIIARLSLKIRTHEDIAAELAKTYPELAVTDRMVGYDLRRAAKIWKKEYVDAIQTQKAKELQELLELRQTTWDCLQRSIGKNRVITKEGKTTGKKDEDGKEILSGQKVVIREEELAGNPGLIAQLVEIDKQIRILMGLDEAQKIDLGDGVKITVVYGDQLPGEASETASPPA